MHAISENSIELIAISELQRLGYGYVHGPELAPDAPARQRTDYSEVLLQHRLEEALRKLNPGLSAAVIRQAIATIRRISTGDSITNNETFHNYLVEGIKVPYQQDGYERSHEVRLIDFEQPEANDFLAVNQFTIIEGNQQKRPDVILFVNGFPLVVIELKNATDEKATLQKAFDQLQTYQATIPSLFTYNAICIISDGHDCKAGTLTSGLTRYMAWKTKDGATEASRFTPQLETLLQGMLNPVTLLDLVRNFIVYEKVGKQDDVTGLTQVHIVKKIAAYHQYHAVNKAILSTVKASVPDGTQKGGVVWHTQGSGKSLSMVFYAGKLVQTLNNPTIVVLTDRNDLDDQLFDTFAACDSLLRQKPEQARDRDHLKSLLKVASGGIVFTTIQKFLPPDGSNEFDKLSDRTNIVVIADEAHRTQYGLKGKVAAVKNGKAIVGSKMTYGLAKYLRDALPKATYIGFTGTPIEGTDVNTKRIFGDYIDVYDISQAVEDGATVRIFYESRLAKVSLDDEGRELIAAFESEPDEAEPIVQEKAKAKWAQLEAIVGTHSRLKNLAQDIVYHYEQRLQVFDGKAMIVAMSRRIAADLYEEIINLRPEWHSDALNEGVIKVVMTASSDDGPKLQKLHTTKADRKTLADRMKDPDDSLKLVIVRDMWLTGFDAPSMHTLYIDKPMRGHNLMQAIARVNRVFKDKPGGLVVDYLGIATDLKKALAFYSEAGGKGDPAETQERAVDMLLEKLDVVNNMFAESSDNYEVLLAAEPQAYYNNKIAFNLERFFKADDREKLSIILQAEEHILGLKDGKNRFVREVSYLSQAYALAVPHETALAHKDHVALLQAIKARLVKFESAGSGGRDHRYETAIRQIVNDALISDQVVDVFDAAGIKKPEISILSDSFLQEIKGMKHKNLALELLKKLLNDEIKVRSKTNLVRSKALLDMLESSIKRYQNNLITTAEIINELINIAKDISAGDLKAAELGMSYDEIAFYEALEVNDSAVQVLGDDQLRVIAREIAEKVRSNASIDWTIKEDARARIMVHVRRTLKKYGYPPDKQEKAVDTILKQAALIADHIT